MRFQTDFQIRVNMALDGKCEMTKTSSVLTRELQVQELVKLFYFLAWKKQLTSSLWSQLFARLTAVYVSNWIIQLKCSSGVEEVRPPEVLFFSLTFLFCGI